MTADVEAIRARWADWRTQLAADTASPQVRDDVAALLAEVDRLRGRIDFSDEWYGARWRRLRELVRGTDIERDACQIMANGTAHSSEPPTYTHQLVRLLWRAKKAEAEVGRLRAERGAARALRNGWRRLARVAVADSEREWKRAVIASGRLHRARVLLDARTRELRESFGHYRDSLEHTRAAADRAGYERGVREAIDVVREVGSVPRLARSVIAQRILALLDRPDRGPAECLSCGRPGTAGEPCGDCGGIVGWPERQTGDVESVCEEEDR